MGNTKIVVAQIGARRHYAVPLAYYRLGMLDRLVTDACSQVQPWRFLETVVPEWGKRGAVRRILDREVPEIPAGIIRGMPLFAVSRTWHRAAGDSAANWAVQNRKFCLGFLRSGFGRAGIVYGFNGAALEIFQAARKVGIGTILDQTAAPWRWNTALLREEQANWPGWEESPADVDVSGALSGREEAEWELSDHIVCGSEFCRSALTECMNVRTESSVVRFPFAGSGTGEGRDPSDNDQHPRAGRFRVLFLGSLQLRKGIQYFYEAARMLGGRGLKFMAAGPSSLSDYGLTQLRKEIDYIGRVPRSEVFEQYKRADILVLPTLSEGAANVVNEAMAAGLPVVTTNASGSRIRHNTDGIIVPERDSQALAESITRLHSDHSFRESIAREARKSAELSRDDTDYMRELGNISLRRTGT